MFTKRIIYFLNKRMKVIINFINSYEYFFKNRILKNIILKNRNLTKNTNYLDENKYQSGDYGVSPTIAKAMHKKMLNIPTYSDLICYLTEKLWNGNLSYLEIGTSVMKNLHQINNHIRNSTILCMDIENPPIVFTEIKENSNNNSVDYLKIDIFETENINKFFHERGELFFDFIFSDASHTYEGLIQEYENIYKNRLNKKFVIYFDDLDFPRLEDAFKKIYKDLYVKHDNLQSFSFEINGWVGVNEKSHLNGIITNFDLLKIFDKDKIFVKKLKKYD